MGSCVHLHEEQCLLLSSLKHVRYAHKLALESNKHYSSNWDIEAADLPAWNLCAHITVNSQGSKALLGILSVHTLLQSTYPKTHSPVLSNSASR